MGIKLLSDADIASQYDGMKILSWKLEKANTFEGWTGGFELGFPNADHPDFDEWMYNGFICYDAKGEHIAWDRWMPNEQTYNLERRIRKEIERKRL